MPHFSISPENLNGIFIALPVYGMRNKVTLLSHGDVAV
jgi:hypothetical protein